MVPEGINHWISFLVSLVVSFFLSFFLLPSIFLSLLFSFFRTLLLDNDALISHSRDIGSTSGARSHNHSNLGDSLGRHSGLVVENSSKMVPVREDLALIEKKEKKETKLLDYLR